METQKNIIKNFFLHLSSQIAFYAIVINLVTLLFKIINKAYPQVNSGYYYYSIDSSLSFPVALIIIVFPIFIILNWYIEKSYQDDEMLKHFWLRKWLIYITLFVSGLILVGDLVTVLYYFLDGQELTTGFLLKVLTLLSISSLVFAYYLSDIRDRLGLVTKKVCLVLSLALIVFSIGLGFSVLGSPRTQRLLKYDSAKVNDLMNINSQIQNFYQINKKLPDNLSVLNNINYYLLPIDTQNNKSYQYKMIDKTSYNLCADFNYDFDYNKNKNFYTDSRGVGYVSEIMPTYDGSNPRLWEYKKGNYCFKLTIPNYMKNQPTPLPLEAI
jgi:type II secretory pathway pseudopilin PulG